MTCGCRRRTSPCAPSMRAMMPLPVKRKKITGPQTSAVASVTYATTSSALPPFSRPAETIVVAARLHGASHVGGTDSEQDQRRRPSGSARPRR